jgi:hypothetical protein
MCPTASGSTGADKTSLQDGDTYAWPGEMQRSRKTDETATDDSDVGMPLDGPIRSMRERLSGVAPVGLQLHALFCSSGSRPTAAAKPEMPLISVYS